MQNGIIKISKTQIGQSEINAVDARELWTWLESKQEFATWVKAKVVCNPYFAENYDYCSFDNIVKRAVGGSIRKDYVLSIDCAKKVSMAEQTEKGNKVRDYFLECEKSSQEKFRPPQDMTKLDWMEMCVDLQKHKIKSDAKIGLLEHVITKQAPKAEAFDAFIDTDGLYSLTEAGKIVYNNPNKFTAVLRKKKIIYLSKGINIPTQRFMNIGYFEVKAVKSQGGRSNTQTFVTAKGLPWLHRICNPGAQVALFA